MLAGDRDVARFRRTAEQLRVAAGVVDYCPAYRAGSRHHRCGSLQRVAGRYAWQDKARAAGAALPFVHGAGCTTAATAELSSPWRGCRERPAATWDGCIGRFAPPRWDASARSTVGGL